MHKTTEMVLVIDDDPGIRSQLRWGLDQYNVITAGNRTTGLELLSVHRPAVVTLDLGLPPDAEGTREGFDTLSEILQQAPDTRVVVVSGALDNDKEDLAMKSGAFSCFSKPINLETLRGVVDRAYQSYRDAHKFDSDAGVV